MTEAQLQDAIVEAARLLGWRVAHFRPARTAAGWRTPGSYDAKGFPDLVLVRDRVVFAELKGAHGVLSDEQRLWASAIRMAGCEHHVWRPKDWLDGTVDLVLQPRWKEITA